MDWRTLQVETEGLKLIDLLNSEFVKYINSEFVDKKIEVTNIQISSAKKQESRANQCRSCMFQCTL